MKSLEEHAVVPIFDDVGRRAHIVYAPSEYEQLVPYAFSYARLGAFWALVVCSGGLLGIAAVWFPQLFTWIARARLPLSAMGDADVVLVLMHRDGFRSQFVEQHVHRPTSDSADMSSHSKQPWVWFEFKRHRYAFNHNKNEFERYLATVSEDITTVQSRLDAGLDASTVRAKTALFGANIVDIRAPRVATLLFTKVVHPFYLFQVFSATVWFLQRYTVYAIVILVLSAASLAYEIYTEVSNSNRLRRLVRSDCVVDVVRVGAQGKVHETELVPGDIVTVAPGPIVADLLLLSGSCVADEASLTGEALPVTKEPVVGGAGVLTDALARTQFKASFLHAGSVVTRVRDSSSRAVVLSTGFSTGKGELFRSILFPTPITFAFERDSYRYLAVLAAIALAAFIKRLVNGAQGGTSFGQTVVNSLDLITIAVPPALPIVLSSGIGFALARLQADGIFCIDAQRINSCGQLTCFCFDKTGTLTQEHLTFAGVDAAVANDDSAADAAPQTFAQAVPATLALAMATCHGLSATDGALQGYALDRAMFDASKFTIEYLHDTARGSYVAIVTAAAATDDGDGDGDAEPLQQFGIVKRFAFDAACQLSSVVVEDLTTHARFAFVKGSPEAVCAIATDMPSSLRRRMLAHSADGLYCIGFGIKEVPATLDLTSRDAVECAVRFVGLAAFRNELKPESKRMLAELHAAAIDVRMITGDSALTAVHVARALAMQLEHPVAVVDVDDARNAVIYLAVDALPTADATPWRELSAHNVTDVLDDFSFAITGAALDALHRDMSDAALQRVLRETRVFARIRPQQKTWIVEQLMAAGLIVGMCGDGTNDCGALKAAHVGLALSSAEASIVAPFTSRAKSVLDVPVLMREGRCALTTSFLAFKFMVLYPIIQLAMVSTLAHVGRAADVDLVLSNNQYLYDDVAIVLVLAISMLYTAASRELSTERPPNTLFSLPIVASLVGHVALFVAFFAAQFAVMARARWFCAAKDGAVFQRTGDTSVPASCGIFASFDIETDGFTFEDTTVWLFGHVQYIAVAAAFNVQDKFRLPFYSNLLFTTTLVAVIAINVYLLMATSDGLSSAFQVMPLPSSHRWIMLALFVGHFSAAVLWEIVATRVLPKLR